MTTLEPAQLLTQLRWRYATKKFDATRRIPPEVWTALEETLVLTPSSFGLQPWRFIVITDSILRQRLVPASWGQTQPADCSHHIVFAARKGLAAGDVERFLDRTSEVRGSSKASLAGYRNVILGSVRTATDEGSADEWCKYQAYIALGNFMTSAAVLGIDTCPMEGIDGTQYDEILGLPALGYSTCVACAAGYRAADDKYASLPKVRFPVDEVVLRR